MKNACIFQYNGNSLVKKNDQKINKMEDPLTFSHPNALVQSCKETFVCLCKHLKTLIAKWMN
jgi:hypothetical protein